MGCLQQTVGYMERSLADQGGAQLHVVVLVMAERTRPYQEVSALAWTCASQLMSSVAG